MIKKYILPLTGFLSVFFIASAKAFCPICTAAVIGGVGLSRWLKIDDSIAGLWIGGFLVSISGWTINWLERKKFDFLGRNILIPIAYYAITLIPLYYYEIIGHPVNVIWGIDKLIFGTIFGSIFFLAAGLKYEEIKKKNSGKAIFPFQKIALPVGTLIILSVIFYFLTR